MEEAFGKLQADGKNNVDTLVDWMKNSKVIEDNKAAEEKAKGLFSDVADKNNVEMGKFQEVLGKLAEEEKTNVGDMVTKLSEKGPEMLKNAMTAAASAVSGALGLGGKK